MAENAEPQPGAWASDNHPDRQPLRAGVMSEAFFADEEERCT